MTRIATFILFETRRLVIIIIIIQAADKQFLEKECFPKDMKI